MSHQRQKKRKRKSSLISLYKQFIHCTISTILVLHLTYMFYQLRCWMGFAPQDPSKPHLAAGHPPLPGLDRWHNPLPNPTMEKLARRVRGLQYRFKKWIEHGCPILPKITMDTRSPSFVLLVIILVIIGMILPEILGLTSGGQFPSIP